MLPMAMLFTLVVAGVLLILGKAGFFAAFLKFRGHTRRIEKLEQKVEILTDIVVDSDLLETLDFDRQLKLKG